MTSSLQYNWWMLLGEEGGKVCEDLPIKRERLPVKETRGDILVGCWSVTVCVAR